MMMTAQQPDKSATLPVLSDGEVVAIIDKYGRERDQLLAILLDIQEASGTNSVSREWARIVARELGIPLSEVFEVLTFYSMFCTEPRGRYLIEICKSTPCKLCDAAEVVSWFENELGIKIGGTTPDRLFSLVHTSCVGACDIGPVAKIGEEVYGHLTQDRVSEIVREYREKSDVKNP